jgi:hypothetical protein
VLDDVLQARQALNLARGDLALFPRVPRRGKKDVDSLHRSAIG